MLKKQNAIQRVISKLRWKTHLGLVERFVPYPARAARLSISLTVFPWWKPAYHKRHLTEQEKEDGEVIWWARWMWVQVSYSRWA